jgi:hypothetical protein
MSQQPSKLELVSQILTSLGAALVWLFVLGIVVLIVYALQ